MTGPITPAAEQVIHTAHVFTQAHRAVIGTKDDERSIKRAAREQAERRLFQACDRHRKEAEE